MSQHTTPTGEWSEVLRFVVQPELRRWRYHVFVQVGPENLTWEIRNEEDGRKALTDLAKWWAKERRQKGSKKSVAFNVKSQREELKALQAAITEAGKTLASLHHASRVVFQSALWEEQLEFRRFLEYMCPDLYESYSSRQCNDEGWDPGWSPETIQEVFDPRGKLLQLHRATTASLKKLKDISPKSLAKGTEHVDFEAVVVLARWYFVATGEKPRTRVPRDHRSSSPEVAATDFEKLVHAVASHAFGKVGGGDLDPKFSTLRTEAIVPALRRFEEYFGDGDESNPWDIPCEFSEE